MIKTLLFGLNVFGLLLIGFFQKSEVEITHNPPATLGAGQETLVEVHIDKTDVTGFAKYQVTLSEGLKAEMVESSGASFTFNDQKAKFIWMALPDAKKFTITYRIIAEDNALGNLKIDSRFSYIYQNERKNYDLPEHIIAVGDASALAAEQIKSSIAEKASNKSATVTGDRKISSAGINQWKVDLTILKSDMQGFAKIEETIPDGYTVIDLKSSSAVFSLEDKKVKYIWYDVPEKETITVSYKMLPVIAMDGVAPKITGNFSYLKNEETIHVPIIGEDEIATDNDEVLADIPDSTSAEIAEAKEEISKSQENTKDAVVAKTDEKVDELAEKVEPETPVVAQDKNDLTSDKAKSENANKTEIKSEPVTENVKKPKTTEPNKTTPPKTESKSNENAVADNTSVKGKVDANIVNVPEPEKGVFYRVQIAAGKNNLKADVFAKLYNFDEGYKLEYLGSWFKYTTGYHQVYKSARDGRERIKTKYDKFQGPFVAAYNDGERITVQEALMITSQKWFQ